MVSFRVTGSSVRTGRLAGKPDLLAPFFLVPDREPKTMSDGLRRLAASVTLHGFSLSKFVLRSD